MQLSKIQAGHWYDTRQGIGLCLDTGRTPPSVRIRIVGPIPRGVVIITPRDVYREIDDPTPTATPYSRPMAGPQINPVSSSGSSSSLPPTVVTQVVVALELSHVPIELIGELLTWQRENGIGTLSDVAGYNLVRLGCALKQLLHVEHAELVVAWLVSKGVGARCFGPEGEQIAGPAAFIAPTKASSPAKPRRGTRTRD